MVDSGPQGCIWLSPWTSLLIPKFSWILWHMPQGCPFWTAPSPLRGHLCPVPDACIGTETFSTLSAYHCTKKPISRRSPDKDTFRGRERPDATAAPTRDKKGLTDTRQQHKAASQLRTQSLGDCMREAGTERSRKVAPDTPSACKFPERVGN